MNRMYIKGLYDTVPFPGACVCGVCVCVITFPFMPGS